MSRRIEWRSAPDGANALVAVEGGTPPDGIGGHAGMGGTVVRSWPAEPGLVADFLNDMGTLGDGDGTDIADPDPDGWGDLVIARSADGDVLYIDPELYWNGIADLFRAHGDDPHPWRGRS